MSVAIVSFRIASTETFVGGEEREPYEVWNLGWEADTLVGQDRSASCAESGVDIAPKSIRVDELQAGAVDAGGSVRHVESQSHTRVEVDSIDRDWVSGIGVRSSTLDGTRVGVDAARHPIDPCTCSVCCVFFNHGVDDADVSAVGSCQCDVLQSGHCRNGQTRSICKAH